MLMLQPRSDAGTTVDTGTMVEVEAANPFLPGTLVSRDAAWMVELWRAGNLHQYGSCSQQVTPSSEGFHPSNNYSLLCVNDNCDWRPSSI